MHNIITGCVIVSVLLGFISSIEGRRCGKDAYITYATSDLLAISASVLSRSLRASGSKKCRLIMLSNDVSWLIRPFIKRMFDDIIDVDLKTQNNRILHEEYGPIWSFNQTGYSRLAFIHNSAMVLNNPDDIFNYPPLAAVPDVGWADTFDINVFMMKPDTKTFKKLLKKADDEVPNPDRLSFSWLFTSTLKEWNSMSCVYNIISSLPDTNHGAYKTLYDTIKIARFTGPNMPWTVPLNLQDKRPEITIEGVGHIYIELPFHEKWWDIFSKYVHSPFKKYLKQFNLGLVHKENHLYLGNVDLHVKAGFFLWKNKSFPKFVTKNGKSKNNEYTTWQILLEGIRGYNDIGLDLGF